MRFQRNRRRLSYEVKNGVVQAKLLERHVVKEIVDRLWLQARIKVWVINQPVGGKTPQNVAGIPDLMGVAPGGKAILLEVKRPGGVHRIAQTLFIDEVKAKGAIAGFVDSWKSCRELFHEHGIELSA